jgi:methyl halide transferase
VENRFVERYSSGNIPWDLGRVDANLKNMIEKSSYKTCKALDIGCGTGDNVIWLAKNGFESTGCDIVEQAIEAAKKKADEAGAACQFLCHDFMDSNPYDEKFDLVIDRGCLHSFLDEGRMNEFSKRVSILLENGGVWFSISGNADQKAEGDIGPPRLTASQLVNAVFTEFEIIKLESGYIDGGNSGSPRAWLCLLRKRAT